MGDSKKISKLLDEKAKVEDRVRRIHRLVFEVVNSDNTEMRTLWSEYIKAKEQLAAINEKIEQLRKKDESSKGVMPKSTVEKTETEKGKTVVTKGKNGIQESIRLVGNTSTSVNKQVKSQQRPVQPSTKPKGINNLKKTTGDGKPKDNGEDKKSKDAIKPQNELDKKTEEDKKMQNELNTEEEKPKGLRQRVKINVIDIRPPQEIEPKPTIPSTRIR